MAEAVTLVVGATGGLGSQVCEALARRGDAVRALVRRSSDAAKVEKLRSLGAEIVVGDLERPETLAPALKGVSFVVTTASAFPGDPRPDAIERLDHQGTLNLVEAAGAAAVSRFVYTSVPLAEPDYEFQRAKRAVEQRLVTSATEYTILRPDTFMEVWFSPVCGFDLAEGQLTIYGDGSAISSWIASADVAEFAVWARTAGAARNAVLDLGGPEGHSYDDIVAVYEELTGRRFARSYVSIGDLERAYAQADTPVERSFNAVLLSNARGGVVDMTELVRVSGIRLTALREFAAAHVATGPDGGGAVRSAAGAGGPILVSVFLPGGADGMTMLYPAGDPLYRKLRPSLGLNGGQAFSEDDRLFWDPVMAPLAQLHAEGKVNVMPAIGYAHPDQSHFTSRHYWEVGATQPDLQTGWMGRYLDAVGSPDNPLQGLSMTGQLEPTLATSTVPVAAISAPNQYTFWTPQVWGTVANRMLETLGAFSRLSTADPAVQAAAEVAVESNRLRQQLLPFAGAKIHSPVAYPQSTDPFPQQLAGVAAMIGAGLPIRCVALEASGEYDTHAEQPAALSTALGETATSLLAFQRDLEARKVADRVITLVWTEFGRRARQNASNGTDHGAGGAAFLIGTRVTGRMVGEFPGLSRGLDVDGNLRATVDFRGVYAALLEQWLGFDAESVIPEASRFVRAHLIRTA